MHGENRFGEPDRKALETLEGITDLTLLETLGVRLLQVQTWQELLADVPPPRSRPRRGPRRANGKES